MRTKIFALILLITGLSGVEAFALGDEPDVCLSSGQGHPCYVTGNGRGYAVVSSADGAVRKFLSHPCSMQKPNAQDPRGDGVETSNYIQRATFEVNGTEMQGQVAYHDESQVILGQSSAGAQEFFMPFGLKRNALIATSQPNAAGGESCLNVKWENPVISQAPKSVDGNAVQVFHFDGVSEPLVAVPLSPTSSTGGTKSKTCTLAGPDWALISVNDDSEIDGAVRDLKAWQKDEPASTLSTREARELNTWRGSPPVCFENDDQRRLYRQSETVLRMAQIQAPNDSQHRAAGLINASLPTGEFVVPFVRDMSYATVGLVQMGHQAEAKQAVLAFFNAGPIGINTASAKGPYQISTARYFCNGQEDADYSEQPQRNFELDSWGLALWATGSYFNKFKDKKLLTTQTNSGPLYQSVRDNVVLPLFRNLDSYKGGLIVTKDTSSWEQNNEARRHYAYSTITAIGGLKQFLPMAEAMGDSATVALVKRKLALLEKGFSRAYIENGHLRGSLEFSAKNDMDGALVEAINMDVPLDKKVITNTLNRLAILKVPSGGYLRVFNPNGNDEYEKHEFVFIDFSLARALLKLGKPKLADKVMARLQDKAYPTNNLIPEMYVSFANKTYPGAVGTPAGAVPMVGYGAGVHNLYYAKRHEIPSGGVCPSALPASNTQAAPARQ